MSGTRRRRRTGSSARRYKPAQLVPIEPRRRRQIGTVEIAACAAVAVVAALLITLIWIVTARAISDQRAEIRERVERTVSAQADTLAEEVRHELLVVDQAVSILQAAWNKDQENFNLADWQKLMPALTSVSDDIFIADEKQVIRQDVLAHAVGQGVGAAYVNFPHGSLETLSADGTDKSEGRLIVGESTGTIDARRYLMYLIRPLQKPTNWLIGASFRSDELTKLYAKASLGVNGVTALIDTTRGFVQAIAGPSARRPKNDLSNSDMLAAIRNKGESGTWTGPTAMDGVMRIHGFSHVPGRDMYVLVGVVAEDAMAPADSLASGARSVAVSASIVVLVVGGLVLWELYTLRANRRRERAFTRGRADLVSMQTELATQRGRAILSLAQVRALLRGSADGVALLDADLRLLAWNPRFLAGSGLPPEALREGLPIDDVMRQQARAGLYGALADPEVEIARRVAILHTEPAGAYLPQLAPDGEEIGIHVEVVPDSGGLVLVLGGVRDWQPTAEQAAAAAVAESRGGASAHEEEITPAAPNLEW